MENFTNRQITPWKSLWSLEDFKTISFRTGHQSAMIIDPFSRAAPSYYELLPRISKAIGDAVDGGGERGVQFGGAFPAPFAA